MSTLIKVSYKVCKLSLSAEFPTMFELMSALCEGGVKYMCLKIKFHILHKNPFGIYPSKKTFW